MPFKIETCTVDDMPRAFELASTVFGEEEFFNALYLDHPSPAGRVAGGERYTGYFKEDKYGHWLKAVDEDGTVVGVARWQVYDGEIPPEGAFDDRYWNTDEEKEYAEHMSKRFIQKRNERIKEAEGRILCLDSLMVDPKYQRRGAGRQLVKWGVELADERGVLAVIEASRNGSLLYEQEGFQIVQDFEIAVPEKWSDRKKQRIRWMERQPKAKGA